MYFSSSLNVRDDNCIVAGENSVPMAPQSRSFALIVLSHKIKVVLGLNSLNLKEEFTVHVYTHSLQPVKSDFSHTVSTHVSAGDYVSLLFEQKMRSPLTGSSWRPSQGILPDLTA